MLATILVVASLLVSISLSFNFGFFQGNLTPIILLTAAFFILLIPATKNKSPFPKPVVILAVVDYAILLFSHDLMWATHKEYVFLLEKIIYILFLPFSFFAIRKKLHPVWSFAIFNAFILAAFLLRILVLSATPFPMLDVFIILKQAPEKLLSGINPYNTFYTAVFPGITPNYYAYWPAAIVLQIPLIILFKDPRVLFILADIAAALLLLEIGNRTRTAQLLVLSYLFRPQSLFIIEGSWLTPLNFFVITLTVYLLLKKGNNILIGIFAGILTSVQFFHAVLVIFLIKYLGKWKNFLFFWIITTALLVLPFFFLNPGKFFLQTVWVYFQNPPHPSILIHTSLSLNTLIFYLSGKDIPSAILYLVIGAILLLLLIRQKNTVSSLIGSITLFFFASFIFGRQAFVNYYYFIGSMIILWMVTLYREDSQSSSQA